MMTPDQRLAYMANQIARNFATMREGAAAATAEHMARFWDPRMKDKIRTMADGLDPIACEAVRLLPLGLAPARQSRATANGGSDAG